jgi:hypothetical protein
VAEAEDRKRAQALRRRVPAYALIGAMVTQDKEAAVLLVDQARTAGSLDLLAFNMASVAAEALPRRFRSSGLLAPWSGSAQPGEGAREVNRVPVRKPLPGVTRA